MRWTQIILALLLVGIGIGIGYFIPMRVAENVRASGCTVGLLLDTAPPYPFVKPLLGVTTSKPCFENKFSALNDQITAVAAKEPAGVVSRYGYFFRDLTDASWTGIHETDTYDPGSMLKVVVALAANKQAELTPGFSASQLTYTQALADINAQLPFAPPIALTVGKSYSVPYLMQKMLSDSDNASKDLLLASLDPEVISKIYSDLNVPSPNSNDSAGYTISPQQYSRFLRILYYGLYDLSWNDSNMLLQTLTNSTYTSGLVAGVPAGISVAHKYGEHINGEGGQVTSVELSDCGIVYHPKRPYLICVMTQGSDETALANFIAQISKVAYNQVDADYK
jgi:beta-lactamase class A